MEEEYKVNVEDMQLLRALMGNIVNDINHVARNSTENSSALRVNPNVTAAQFQNTLKTLVQTPVVKVKEESSYPTPDGGSIPIPPVANPALLQNPNSTPIAQTVAANTANPPVVAKQQVQLPIAQSSEIVLAIGKLDATLVELNKTLQNCSFYNVEKAKKKLKKKKNGIRNQSRNVG